VRRGEIETRFDCNYWASTRQFNDRYAAARYPLESLGQNATEVQYGCSDLANEEGRGLRMVRMNNLQGDEWDFTNVKRVPLGLREARRYRLRRGDLLFNRTNSKELVGKCGVFDESGVWVFASYLIRVRTDAEKLLPQFASFFINSPAGRIQIDRVSRQIIGMTNVNAEELRELRIPLPPLAKQRELVDAMEAARVARRAKLAEADALLAGMDAFVLDALGLVPPNNNRRVFAVRRAGLARLDADYHSPRFRAIRESIERAAHSVRAVGEICERISTGFAAGAQDQAFDDESGVPHLRPLNLNTYGEISLAATKRVPRSSVSAEDWCEVGEVLFNNTNSTEMVGKSAVFDMDTPCACSNHITRLKLRQDVNNEFIAALFNALRSIGYLGMLSTNFNNQAGINTSTLGAVRIPVPDTSLQQAIAAEIGRRRERARALRVEAETSWAQAKRWFEEQLLGPV
jgi:type I restriction enzyme S subunit